MAFVALTDQEIAPDRAVTADLLAKVKGNFDDHEARIGAGGGGSGGGIGEILNGSLETDSDVNDIPDNFTRYLYPGGSAARDITDSIHGKYSYKFVHPGGVGAGGGYLETDYVAISHLYHPDLPFAFKKSAAGTRVEIVGRFYAQDSLGNPSSYIGQKVLWTTTGTAYPRWMGVNLTKITHTFPTARFVKYRLIGGKSDVNAAGSVWFDAIGIPLLVPTRMPIPNTINQAQINVNNSYPDGWRQIGSVWTVDIQSAAFRYLKIGVLGRGVAYFPGEVPTYQDIYFPLSIRFTLGTGGNAVTSQQVDFGYDEGTTIRWCICELSTLAVGTYPLRFYYSVNTSWHTITTPEGFFSSVNQLNYIVGAQISVDVSTGVVTEVQG